MKTQDFFHEVEKGILRPFYYFGGPEKWLIEEALRKVEEKALDPATRDFNRVVWNGDEETAETLLASFQVLPVRSSWRLVVIHQADSLWKRNPSPYIEYFQDPNPQTCVIFIGEKVDPKAKFFQALEKRGAVLSFYPLQGKELFRWVHSQAQLLGYSLSEEAATLLRERIGSSLQEIRMELQKLILGKEPGTRIEPEDVIALTEDVRGENPFDLARAVGALAPQEIFRLLRKNLGRGESPVFLLSLILYHLRLIRKARDLQAQGFARREIEARLKILPSRAGDFWKQVERFPPSLQEDLWPLTLRADQSLKSSRADKGLLLEEYLWGFCLRIPEALRPPGDGKRRFASLGREGQGIYFLG